MNPEFNLQFRIDRKNPDARIVLTDASTGFSSSVIAGNFRVTYPDGTVRQNTDSQNPDISAVDGSVDYPLRADATGKVLQGDYVVVYTVVHGVDGTFPITKSFTLSWEEPVLDITDTSDVLIPEVAFSDEVDYTRTGWTPTITRTMMSDFPTTSDAVGNPQNTSGAALNMVLNANYYEGIYDDVELDNQVSYVNDADAWLSVYFHAVVNEQFDIRKVPSKSEIVGYINNFKEAQNLYINNNTNAYLREEAKYQQIMTRYTHLFERVALGQVQESFQIYNELINLLLEDTTYTYQSGPIEGFDTGSGGGGGTANPPIYIIVDPAYIVPGPGTFIYRGTAAANWTMPDLAVNNNLYFRFVNHSPNQSDLTLTGAVNDEFKYLGGQFPAVPISAGELSKRVIAEDFWTI